VKFRLEPDVLGLRLGIASPQSIQEVVMKRIALISMLTVAGMAITFVAVGGAQTTDGTTITLFQDVGHETNALVDNAPKSPTTNPGSRRFRLSPGDELVAGTPIFDRRGGKRVGTLYARAQVVSGRTFEKAVFQADATLVLGSDSIAFTGLVSPDERPFAVIGGTGAYEGARGSATETEKAGGADLVIRLLR
jgi:hypothetical protein